MLQSSIVAAAAWLEILTGAMFLTVPDVPSLLLFAAKPESLALTLARVAGVALVALGVACRPSAATGPRSHTVLGLFVFNGGVSVLLAWVGVATIQRGPLLWPAVILHAVIAMALLSQLVAKRRFESSP